MWRCIQKTKQSTVQTITAESDLTNWCLPSSLGAMLAPVAGVGGGVGGMRTLSSGLTRCWDLNPMLASPLNALLLGFFDAPLESPTFFFPDFRAFWIDLGIFRPFFLCFLSSFWATSLTVEYSEVMRTGGAGLLV